MPDDLTQRLKQRAVLGASEVDVIRKGLDALDWQDGACVAIQEGIDAMDESRVQDFDEFDREFREQNGIARDA